MEFLARWPGESCACQTSQNLKDTGQATSCESPVRPGQTLQDLFATENMAYAEAAKVGVGIDPDRRACHMFIKSGVTDDQINHIHGFVYDSEVEGPGVALDP